MSGDVANRVYLPQTLLHKYGLATDDVLTLTAMMSPFGWLSMSLDDGYALYERALQGMSFIPFRSRVGILMRAGCTEPSAENYSERMAPTRSTDAPCLARGAKPCRCFSSAGYLSPDHGDGSVRHQLNGVFSDTDTCLASA